MKRVPVLLLAAALAAACGKKGPPLPPIVRVPAAPGELTAVRQGDMVEVVLNMPAANTDGSRPANVERVDVYAFSGPDLKDEDLFKLEPTLTSITVKAPRDPDQAVEEDESIEDLEPPEGTGLDQGARAVVREQLTAASLTLPVLPGKKPPADALKDWPRPMLGPPPVALARTYVAVAISTNNRKGPMSRRALVPLIAPPPPPMSPGITYTENTVMVTWAPPIGFGQIQDAAAEELLPSSPIGVVLPSLSYNVYEPSAADVTAEAASAPPLSPAGTSGTGDGGNGRPASRKLTDSPVSDPVFTDTRMDWGNERCYEVRTVETLSGLSIESEVATPVCTMLVDTFPPKPPIGLTAVPSEGTINLIWQPSDEKDLQGYFVLRGADPEKLEKITPAPIQDTTFKDSVAAGGRYVYAVKAIDQAGNESEVSNRVEETAR